MSKIPDGAVSNIKDILSRGCDYAGTQEIVNEMVEETLSECGIEIFGADCIGLNDGEKDFETLDVFVNIFWDKATEAIMNVVESEEW